MARSRKVWILAFPLALGLKLSASPAGDGMQKGEKLMAVVDKKEFGKMPDGTVIDSYTLSNSHGASAKVITYGATLTELHVPDKQGKMADVVLGFDALVGYLGQHPYFGGTIGREPDRPGQVLARPERVSVGDQQRAEQLARRPDWV